MTEDKKNRREIHGGIRRIDHPMIWIAFTDVVWKMPGVDEHHGKEEFDKEIEKKEFCRFVR